MITTEISDPPQKPMWERLIVVAVVAASAVGGYLYLNGKAGPGAKDCKLRCEGYGMDFQLKQNDNQPTDCVCFARK